MEEGLTEQTEYRGFNIKVFPDDGSESPRDWDNLGTMVCFHSRYGLGDDTGLKTKQFGSWDRLDAYLWKEENAAVVLPLYLYDHSGITMKTSSFGDAWDSSKVGAIFVSKDKIRKEYDVKHISKQLLNKVHGYLENEVRVYNKYLTGEAYGYVIEDPDGNNVDSCWGSYEEPNEIIQSCKTVIDGIIKNALAYPQVVVKASNNCFTAHIRESVDTPTYLVIVGSDEWNMGKGKGHEKEIIEQMGAINKKLNELATNL